MCALFLSLTVVSSRMAESLQEAVAQAMSGREGAAVVLDVETGRIVASYRMDVAARRLASPGSTVKPFTLMAMVEEGVVNGETAWMCPTIVRAGGRTLDCSHPRISNPVDPVLAIAHSCNHFFIHAADRLSMTAIYRVFTRAGLGSPTGKWETEIAGSVQQPLSKDAMQLMGIGESNIVVTPLGLAEAYRSIAFRLRESHQKTEELRLILKGLEAAVDVGTGRGAAARTIRVAGKTGTSAGHAWFAGFAPAGNPSIVVVVFLERGAGGSDAAPLAGRIFQSYSSQ